MSKSKPQTTIEHILKTLPNYWDAVQSGAKTFEVRRDDRGFQRGDILVLRRLRPQYPHAFDADVNGEYRELRKRISYVLTGGQFGIELGFVVMGLQEP